MKFLFTNAFLAALAFRGVSGERIGSSRIGSSNMNDFLQEDAEFWKTFADRRLSSMVEQTPSPTAQPVEPEPSPSIATSDAPSDGPSMNEISNPPSYGTAKPITDAPTISCQTITEVACSLPEFEILCALVGDANLGAVLDGEDEITLFAPINTAFENLPIATAEAVVSDLDLLSTVLLSHAVPGYIFSTDLECGAEISMVSGVETTTLCSDGNIFQTGAGNGLVSLPQVIAPDGETCNGVIHAISEVILPAL